MKTKKYVSVVTMLAYLSCMMPIAALADDSEEKITSVRKGQTAPYNGTLFSTAAAARLQVDLKFTEQTCKIETERQMGVLRSKLQLDIDLLNARVTSQTQLHEDVLKAKNDQIKFLESYSLETKWYKSNEFWLVTGLISGIAVTAVAGWALGQADN